MVLTSCKKNDTPQITTSSNFEKLIDTKWKLSSLTGNIAGENGKDLYTDLPEWDKDNHYFFKQNMTYKYDANEIMEPGENKKVLVKGIPELTGDNIFTVRERGPVDGIDPFKIITITESTRVLEQADNQSAGDKRAFGFTVIS